MERTLKVQIIPAAPGFNALTFYLGDNNKYSCDRFSVIAWKLLIATHSEIGVIDGKPQYGDVVIEAKPVLPGIDDGFELIDAIEHPCGTVQDNHAIFTNVDRWLESIDKYSNVSEG